MGMADFHSPCKQGLVHIQGRTGLKQTIFVSGEFGLLQMVSESFERRVNKDAGS